MGEVWLRTVRPGHRLALFALGLGLGGCAGSGAAGRPAAPGAPAAEWQRVAVRTDTLRFVDPARHRPIPVVTYAPGAPGGPRAPRLKVALLSHGYGGQNTAYTFLARNLVAHGYFVASLQHELPGDAPLPTTGNPQQTRRPNWEQGVQSLVFVLGELKRTHPALDARHVLLVGHSNGGDMVMLFAREHPALVERVISLDNRRMPFPWTRRPRIFSLRSSDQVADSGVVPSPAEQARFGTTVVWLPATQHNDIWDGATESQKREMNALISRFLEQ